MRSALTVILGLSSYAAGAQGISQTEYEKTLALRTCVIERSVQLDDATKPAEATADAALSACSGPMEDLRSVLQVSIAELVGTELGSNERAELIESSVSSVRDTVRELAINTVSDHRKLH